MIAAGCGIQYDPGAVTDLGPLGKNSRIVVISEWIPGHNRHVRRGGTWIHAGARPMRDFSQDPGNALIIETKPDPDHMAAIHKPSQHTSQFTFVCLAIFSGGKNYRVWLVMSSVRIQNRQFGITKNLPISPAIKPKIIAPRGESGRRRTWAHTYPSIDDPGIVVCRNHTFEGTPAYEFVHRCPRSTRHRVSAGAQYLPQHLAKRCYPQAPSDDLHNLFWADRSERLACRSL
jgi:hypothetical protein